MQITPVAPGRNLVKTTASKKDGGGGGPRPGAVCSCNIDVAKLQTATTTAATMASGATAATTTSTTAAATNQATSIPLSSAVASTTAAAAGVSSSTALNRASLGTSASASNVATKSQHPSTSSLDLTTTTKQTRELTNEELIKYLQQLNGDLKWIDQAQLKQLTKDYEFLKAVVDKINQQRAAKQSKSTTNVGGSTSSTAVAGTSSQQQLADHQHVHHQQKPLHKSYQQLVGNGDLEWQYKPEKVHTLHHRRKLKSFEAEQDALQTLLRNEYFDRSLDQRHSSRSAEAARTKDDDWTQTKQHHLRQRHLSGPSDLSQLRDDISEWLIALSLQRKQSQQQQQQQKEKPPPALPPKPGPKPTDLTSTGTAAAAAGSTSASAATAAASTKQQQQRLQFKDELSEILKRPLQRQSSGPPDLTSIKKDLLQWLTKQQQALSASAKQKEDLDRIQPAPISGSGGATSSSKKTVPKLVKRHSLGPGEEIFFKEPMSAAPFVQYQRIHKDKPNVIQLPSSCVDIHRNSDRVEVTSHPTHQHQHPHGSHPHQSSLASGQSSHHMQHHTHQHHQQQRALERKLRHSASEVVTPTSERAPTTTTSIQKTLHYLYQAKTPTKSALVPSTSIAGSVAGAAADRKVKKERVKRPTTQRSATVSEMEIQGKLKLSHSRRRQQTAETPRSQTPQPWVPCTDPDCPYLPICTDPNCYMNLYDTPRCASLPRAKEKVCLSTCYECNQLSSSSAITATAGPSGKCMIKGKIKSNSLPRCVTSTHRSNSHPTSLTRDDSKSSLPRHHRSRRSTSTSADRNGGTGGASSSGDRNHHHKTANGGNGKLIKSISAASLNSRRRRHKTVHFGENLLREVCQNRKLIKPLQEMPSGSHAMQPNIQMLYNFVEGVLSSWVDEDDDHKSGPESEPERGAIMKPLHRCNRIRLQTIRRVVNEAAELRGTLKLGNSRYRHRHWRGTAKDCNERFLRRVSLIIQDSFYIKLFLGIVLNCV